MRMAGVVLAIVGFAPIDHEVVALVDPLEVEPQPSLQAPEGQGAIVEDIGLEPPAIAA
jgi:hypothetical protein